MIEYGDLIRICRKSKDLSQSELGKKANVSKAAIASYETGRIIPRVDVLSDLLEVCGYELGIREIKRMYTAEDVGEIMKGV